jgi:inner membrane protein
VDNICHTLVGAALAQTGLKRRTGLGAATLMIGANFPDIDVLSIAAGRATEFRRGWTHGILALVVLPFVLTVIMIAWDRFKRRRGHVNRAPIVPRELLLLAAVSILTHPTLDWMNSYGMRWLMPFDGKWFYGDSLFIVDPWLLLVLGLGVWLSRRRERVNREDPWRPARVALGVAAAYVITMLGLQNIAEGIVRSDLAGSGWLSHTLMVSASPANPVRWTVYADDGARYWKGAVSLAPGVSRRLIFDERPIEKHAGDPAAIAAAHSETGRRFLNWARLPYYQVERGAGLTRVEIFDARYGASVAVAVD